MAKDACELVSCSVPASLQAAKDVAAQFAAVIAEATIITVKDKKDMNKMAKKKAMGVSDSEAEGAGARL